MYTVIFNTLVQLVTEPTVSWSNRVIKKDVQDFNV